MPSINMSAGVRGELLSQLASDVQKIPCDSINPPTNRKRPLDRKAMENMRESILDTGLAQPIGIRCTLGKGYEVVFGAHRLAVWQELFAEAQKANDQFGMKRWHEIPAIVYPDEMSDEMARLLEINENDIRLDLTTAQRQANAGERAELRKVLGLDKKVGSKTDGGSKGSSGPPCGPSWPDIIESTGIAKTTLKHWWDSYTKEKGLLPDAPSKQDKKYCDSFIVWLKGAEERQKDAKAELESTQRLEAICGWLDSKKAEWGQDCVTEAARRWLNDQR
jgi:hypothetical protein